MSDTSYGGRRLASAIGEGANQNREEGRIRNSRYSMKIDLALSLVILDQCGDILAGQSANLQAAFPSARRCAASSALSHQTVYNSRRDSSAA